MKNTIFRNITILTLVLISIVCFAQKKEKVTITGKVTVKDTGKPPIGIITVLEKGVADYYALENIIGTNHHTFVDKNGTFRFTINKGGTIVIHDGGNRYMARRFFKLDKSQTLDVVLSPTKRTMPPAYPANELKDFEKKTDIHKRIKISGKITFPDGIKGMQNATIGQLDVYNEEAPGPYAHTTSKKGGIYEYTVLKGGRISFGAPGYDRQIFTATKDTVINVKMKRVNPFR